MYEYMFMKIRHDDSNNPLIDNAAIAVTMNIPNSNHQNPAPLLSIAWFHSGPLPFSSSFDRRLVRVGGRLLSFCFCRSGPAA